MQSAIKLLTDELSKLTKEVSRLKLHIECTEAFINIYRKHGETHLSECGGMESVEDIKKRLHKCNLAIVELSEAIGVLKSFSMPIVVSNVEAAS